MLFTTEKLIGQKSGITYIFSYNQTKIKVETYNSLPIEKSIDFA